MSLNECASCDHVNPADAKFCNACGTALPSPPWAGHSTSDFLSAVRSERGNQESGALVSAASPSLAAALVQTEPLADPLEPIAYAVQFDPDQTVRIGCVYSSDGLVAAANSDFDPAGTDSRRLGLDTQRALAQAAASTAEMIEMAAPADAAPTAGDASMVRRTWQRWPTTVIIGASAFVAVVAFAYFGFVQQSAPDISWPAAASGDVNVRSDSADSGTAARRSVGDISGALPPPSTVPAAPAAMPSETAPGKLARQQVEPGRVPAARQRDAAAVAAMVARTAAQTSGIAPAPAPAPARIGPCTDAVAALGLCTPDSTQRKQ